MAQNTVNYSNNPTGPQLLDDYLAKDQENHLTCNSGIQRPSYAQPGTIWINTAFTGTLRLMLYTGDGDVFLGSADINNNVFSAAITNVVTLTGMQTISGTKTFSSLLTLQNGLYVQHGSLDAEDASIVLVPTVATNTNDTNAASTAYVVNVLKALYPVGSIYIGTQSTCPLATLISGSTWELVSSGRVLQGADNNHAAGTTIAAGLPNITGSYYEELMNPSETGTGALEVNATAANRGNTTGNYGYGFISFDASRSSSIYGQSNTVQPPAYVVNIWRRTA